MKKVLLLGDSIRMGYDEFVKEELNGEFEVFYDNDDNGRFSAYTIWMFNQMNNKYGPFDYVHFNTGYWDLNTEGPNKEPQTPIEDYVHNHRRLIALIKETGAIPIFATTTPIYEEKVEGHDPIPYPNSRIISYNNAALKLMKEENVHINDLYSLMLQGKYYYKCADSLHLIEEGYKTCAKQIANIIRIIDNNLKNLYI